LNVVLASSSPQRSEILRKLGVDFEVVVPGVDELTGGDPEVEVLENARRKAGAVGLDGMVIACDTDVVLDGRALGKPADELEAREYLDRMSGRAHDVLSGLVVLADGEERSGLVAGAFGRLCGPDARLDARCPARGQCLQRGRSAGGAAGRAGARVVRVELSSEAFLLLLG
jgi:hypothetical protein